MYLYLYLYEHLIAKLQLGVDWAVVVEILVIKYNNKMFVVINMYTPYETNDNEAEYFYFYFYFYFYVINPYWTGKTYMAIPG